MKLVRFLAAGKSLVGLKDTEGRYQLPKSSVLPRFGIAKDTEGGTGTELTRQPTQAGMEPVASAADVRTDVALGKVETGVRGGGDHSSPQPAPQPSIRPGKIKTVLKKFLGWLPWFGKTPVAAAIPVFSSLPVQTELSLENVKVVRNDLSESDLEFQSVASRPAVNPFSREQVRESIGVAVNPSKVTGAGDELAGN